MLCGAGYVVRCSIAAPLNLPSTIETGVVLWHENHPVWLLIVSWWDAHAPRLRPFSFWRLPPFLPLYGYPTIHQMRVPLLDVLVDLFLLWSRIFSRIGLDWMWDGFNFVCLLPFNRQVRGQPSHQIAQKQLEEPQHWWSEKASKGEGCLTWQASMIVTFFFSPSQIVRWSVYHTFDFWFCDTHLQQNYNIKKFKGDLIFLFILTENAGSLLEKLTYAASNSALWRRLRYVATNSISWRRKSWLFTWLTRQKKRARLCGMINYI